MAKLQEPTPVGAKVVAVRQLTAAECVAEGWEVDDAVVALVFDNGMLVYASRDDEGNGPGVLFGRDKHGAFRIGAVSQVGRIA